ncbi:MAG: macro domain-containing protein, partial [Roseiflexaceae bacterium]|nr:macro domain-containing protein [Roseiflexaceae bacterium]
MITITQGNLLAASVEALVNTVNTVGVMGKGIALQFRQAFPENYAAYQAACRRKEVQPGRMLVVPTNQLVGPRLIINFPTKRHWKGKSRIEDIDAGLIDLVRVVHEHAIQSIAIPPLGCGNGGLDWQDVRPRIEAAFAALPDVRVLLYEPDGAPDADTMPVGTRPPKMTPARAALIGLMARYAEPGYRLSMLEIQKLAYFLQTAGEDLKLEFVKGPYGPYAETINHVLQRLESHHIRGYGDRSEEARITLLQGADEAAQERLEAHQATLERFD